MNSYINVRYCTSSFCEQEVYCYDVPGDFEFDGKMVRVYSLSSSKDIYKCIHTISFLSFLECVYRTENLWLSFITWSDYRILL